MVSVVLFDLWNTLVSASTYETTVEIARRFDFPADFDPYAFLYETVKPLMTNPVDREREFFRKTLLSWDSDLSDEQIAVLTAMWQRRLADSRVFDDAVETLDALTSSHRLGLISNLTPHALDVFTSRFDLEGRFEHCLYSCREGVAKPDAAIFERALQRFGAEAGDAVFVGDSYALDVDGPKAVGIAAFWLNRTKKSPPANARFLPDAVISTLTELPDALETLSR